MCQITPISRCLPSLIVVTVRSRRCLGCFWVMSWWTLWSQEILRTIFVLSSVVQHCGLAPCGCQATMLYYWWFYEIGKKLYGNVEYGCSFHFVRLIRKFYDNVEFGHLFHLSLAHLGLATHIKASLNWVIIDSHDNAHAKPLAEPMLTYCQLDP